MIPLPTSDRKCGGCNACCTVLAIVEMGKPYYCSCQHLGEGCNIYQSRPPVCREYNCEWMHGAGDNADRPDRLGVMFHLDVDDVAPHFWIEVFETRPNAFEQVAGKIDKIINGIADFYKRKFGVRFYRHDSLIACAFTILPPYPDLGESNGRRDFMANEEGDVLMFAGGKRGLGR